MAIHSLEGYSPQGQEESDTTEHTHMCIPPHIYIYSPQGHEESDTTDHTHMCIPPLYIYICDRQLKNLTYPCFYEQ